MTGYTDDKDGLNVYSAGYHTANAAGMLSRLCADAKRVR